jgi:murein DD-endopeptidase MepM/ murein hydrolase activator NlpD
MTDPAYRTRSLVAWASLICLAFASAAAAAPPTARLPKKVEQGALVTGHTAPDCTVLYAGRKLRVGPDGEFVLGVGRDAQGPLQIRIACPGQRMQIDTISVVHRNWPTERVNGVPEKTVRPPPAIAKRIAREHALVRRLRTRDTAQEDFEHGFRWPVHGRISDVFGGQRIYNGVPRAPHSGVDIAVPQGTPVRAPAAGVVTLARYLYLSGNTVMINHGFGISSVMLHMRSIRVKPGESVRQGQVVGRSGMTGRATGPHVHWGMNWFGVRLDPALVAGTPAD